MNLITRQKLIIDKIKMQGEVTTKELTEELNVSSMTIRRDFQALEKIGKIQLTHGGAILKDYALERPMSYKEAKYVAEKKAIANFAASFVREGDIVFIETGSTTQAIVGELTEKNNLTVHTNSIMAANTLANFENISLYMAPGEYRELSKGFVGPLTNKYIKQFYYDVAFLGTEGIDLIFGLSVPNLDDALAKKSLIENAKKVILVADHSKFEQKFLCKICDLKKIAHIITDEHLSNEIYEQYTKKGINITRVKIDLINSQNFR